jgi:hypothetical protein
MWPLVSPDKLVYMANQIGKFFASQGEDQAVAGIANHLRKYWDPRMRSTIVDFGAWRARPLISRAPGRWDNESGQSIWMKPPELRLSKKRRKAAA